MRRQLGVIVLTASLIACGGDSGPDDEEEFGGGAARSDAGVQRDASTQADDGARPGAGQRGDAPGSTTTPSRSPSSSSSVDVVFTYTEYVGVLVVQHLVTLFKDGWGCYDSDVLNPTTNLASHRASQPGDWFQWRRGAGGRLERLDKKGSWVSLGAEDTYPPLARGFALNGNYGHTATAGGSLVFGGRVTQLQFSRDLTFSVGAGGAARRGTYFIDGYGITLTDASGRSEVHSIVGNSSYFWFDGARYMR